MSTFRKIIVMYQGLVERAALAPIVLDGFWKICIMKKILEILMQKVIALAQMLHISFE